MTTAKQPMIRTTAWPVCDTTAWAYALGCVGLVVVLLCVVIGSVLAVFI